MHVYNLMWPCRETNISRKPSRHAASFFQLPCAFFPATALKDLGCRTLQPKPVTRVALLYANYASKEDLFIALLEEQSVLRISKIADAVASTEGTTAYQSAIRQLLHQPGQRSAMDSAYARNSSFMCFATNSIGRNLLPAYRRIREAVPNLLKMMNLDQNGLQMPERHTKVLLGVILNGLLLEQACDPQQVSSQEVIFLLGRMFDLLTLSS